MLSHSVYVSVLQKPSAGIVAKLLSMDQELSYAMAEKPDKDNQEKVLQSENCAPTYIKISFIV